MVDLCSPTARRAATVAFGLYLLVLAGAAFLPLPGPPPPFAASGVAVNLTLSRPDLLGGWEAQRNVLMTVPFGLLLPLVVRWRYELMVLACVAVTLVIETGQLLGSLLVGWPWRSFDVDDLLHNSVGALLGLAVTGAVLALRQRPARPAPHRLVVGALAVALVVWALAATATTPPVAPVVYACDEPPGGPVTALPGGAEAYAGSDGGLCLQLGTTSSSVLPGAETGPQLTSDDGRWEVGVAVPGAEAVTDGAGAPVQPVAVEGSELLVWASERS